MYVLTVWKWFGTGSWVEARRVLRQLLEIVYIAVNGALETVLV